MSSPISRDVKKAAASDLAVTILTAREPDDPDRIFAAASSASALTVADDAE